MTGSVIDHDVENREPLCLSVLGSCRLTISGVEVPLKPAHRTILARLALGAPTPVSSDQLFEALWGDHPPESARNAVQVHMSRLRALAAQHGHNGLIVTKPQGYALDATLAIDWLDLIEAAATAVHSIRTGRFARGLSEISRALEPWRGTPLAELPDDLDAQALRGRLQATLLDLWESQGDAWLAIGVTPSAVNVLADRAARHLERERFTAQYAVALVRSDRQLDALAWLRDHRTRLIDEFGVEPGRDLAQLEHRILVQDPSLLDTSTSPRSVLPTLPRPALGRDHETSEIVDILRAPGTRLVTITGVGGLGKSTLAVAVAHAALEHFPGGVVLADLSGLSEAQACRAALVGALGTDQSAADSPPFGPGWTPLPTLLIADDIEASPEATLALADLIRGHVTLTVLATSRAVLGARGETVFWLKPLPSPSKLDPSAAGSPGVRLFLRAGRAAAPDLAESAELTSLGVDVVDAVGGHPLSIELVAGWLRLMSPAGLAERLSRPLDLLVTHSVDRPQRHRSVVGLLDASVALLPPAARDLYERLGAVRSGVRLDTLDAVIGNDLGFDALLQLVDASLLRRSHDPDGESRFTMPRAVFEHAAQRLTTRDDSAIVGLRADQFIFDRLEAAQVDLRGQAGAAYRASFRLERPWVYDAIDRAVGQQRVDWAVELATKMHPVWGLGGAASEGIAVCTRLLAETSDDPVLRAKLLGNAAVLAGTAGRLTTAAQWARESVEILSTTGDHLLYGRALSILGGLLTDLGETVAALDVLDAALEARASAGDRPGVVVVMTQRALARLASGDVRRAVAEFAEIDILAAGLGRPDAAATARYNRGIAAMMNDDQVQASEDLLDALDRAVQIDDELIGYVVAAAATLNRSIDLGRSVWLASAAVARLRDSDLALEPLEQRLLDATIEATRTELGYVAFVARWDEGRDASPDEVLRVARAVLTAAATRCTDLV